MLLVVCFRSVRSESGSRHFAYVLQWNSLRLFYFLLIYPRVSHRPEVASIQPIYSSEEDESGEKF